MCSEARFLAVNMWGGLYGSLIFRTWVQYRFFFPAKFKGLGARFCLYKQNSMLLLVQIYAPSLAQKLSDLLLIPGQTFFAPLFAKVKMNKEDE
jgi:hypothetical protein